MSFDDEDAGYEAARSPAQREAHDALVSLAQQLYGYQLSQAPAKQRRPQRPKKKGQEPPKKEDSAPPLALPSSSSSSGRSSYSSGSGGAAAPAVYIGSPERSASLVLCPPDAAPYASPPLAMASCSGPTSCRVAIPISQLSSRLPNAVARPPAAPPPSPASRPLPAAPPDAPPPLLGMPHSAPASAGGFSTGLPGRGPAIPTGGAPPTHPSSVGGGPYFQAPVPAASPGPPAGALFSASAPQHPQHCPPPPPFPFGLPRSGAPLPAPTGLPGTAQLTGALSALSMSSATAFAPQSFCAATPTRPAPHAPAPGTGHGRPPVFISASGAADGWPPRGPALGGQRAPAPAPFSNPELPRPLPERTTPEEEAWLFESMDDLVATSLHCLLHVSDDSATPSPPSLR